MQEENVVPLGKSVKTFRHLSEDPRIEVLFFSQVSGSVVPCSFRASMVRLEGTGTGKSAIVLQDGTTITLALPYAQLVEKIDEGYSPVDLQEYCETAFPAAQPQIGARMADGSVFAGFTSDGRQMCAMPNDLGVCMTFNDAAKAVTKLNNDKALGHDDWKIPSVENLRVLYKYQNEGALKGTFSSGSGFPGWYWSSTEGRDDSPYVHSIRFSDGRADRNLMDCARYSCRPVRLVDAKRL